MKTAKDSSEEPTPAYYGRCSAPECGAEIAWTVSLYTRKRMPVDWQPVDDGNVAVHLEGGELVSRVLRQGEQPRDNERLAVSHYVTCPAAARFRRSKAAS